MRSTNYAYLLIFAILASACSSDLHKMVRKGNKKFEKGEYQFAISDYEEGLADGADTAIASFQIAESYRLSNRIREAIPYYEAALKSGRQMKPLNFILPMVIKQLENTIKPRVYTRIISMREKIEEEKLPPRPF